MDAAHRTAAMQHPKNERGHGRRDTGRVQERRPATMRCAVCTPGRAGRTSTTPAAAATGWHRKCRII
jgi:hypothetical protein